MLLLACNDTTGLNPAANSGDDNNAAKGSVTELQNNPNASAAVIIADDVKQWMEEQLASKSGEKRRISIFEMYQPDIESAAGLSATINSDGKTEYFLNGNKISFEEYQSKWEYERQRANYDKRDLSIPGEIIHNTSNRWTVLMTAEEIAEVLKKYDKLLIEFYAEMVNE
jgi:hypothetical protein